MPENTGTGIVAGTGAVGAIVAGGVTETAGAVAGMVGVNGAPTTGTPAWDGQWATVEKESWYSGLPEDARGALRVGGEKRWKEWESGYTKRVQDHATKEKSWGEERGKWDSERASWATKEQAWATEKASLAEKLSAAERLKDILLSSEDDPRLKTYDSDKAAWAEKETKLQAEIDSLKGQYQKAEEQIRADYVNHLEKNFSDILANDAALERFGRLLDAGEGEDDAAAYVRGIFKLGAAATPAMPAEASTIPVAPTEASAVPVVVPDDVRLAANGKNTPSAAETRRGGKYEGMTMEQALRASLRSQPGDW